MKAACSGMKNKATIVMPPAKTVKLTAYRIRERLLIGYLTQVTQVNNGENQYSDLLGFTAGFFPGAMGSFGYKVNASITSFRIGSGIWELEASNCSNNALCSKTPSATST